MTSVSDLLDLVRAPAALTVLGDTVAGRAAAGLGQGGVGLPLAGASVLLYTAGMALNDYADADLDAIERPERPIPSGRVSKATALTLAAGLTAGGLGLAALAGRRHLAVAVPLAGLIWSYDLVAKPTLAGPVVMAGCRAADVLLGAGATGQTLRAAAPAAAVVGVHTLSLTALSRGEVHGTNAVVPKVAAITTAGLAAFTVGAAARRGGPRSAIGALIGAAGYLATVLPAQLKAARTPGAAEVRTATRAGIGAVVPLQAALTASRGSFPAAAALAGVTGLGRVLAARRKRGDTT